MSIDQPIIVRTLMRDRAKLLAFIWSIVHDGHIAEDVLQDVSVLAVEKRDEIESEAVLGAWLRTTARHRALYAMRRDRRSPLTLDEHVLDLMESEWRKRDSPDGPGADRVMSALRSCLTKLTPSVRQVIQLRYGQSLSSQQIANQLGRSIASIYKATTRAHASLAECVRRTMQQECE